MIGLPKLVAGSIRLNDGRYILANSKTNLTEEMKSSKVLHLRGGIGAGEVHRMKKSFKN